MSGRLKPSAKPSVAPALRLSVKVKPRASRSRVLQVSGLELEASLAAPPVDGAANAELLRLLSEALDVPKSTIRLVLGETSRQKVVEVVGLSADEAVARLARAGA